MIMTSNIGSAYLTDNIKEDGSIDEDVKLQVEDEMKKHFRPEFINRIDDIVVFSPLTENEIVSIIRISLADIERRLEERNIKLELTEKGIKKIADDAYSPNFGARPVKRYLQKHVETEIASMIISGELTDDQVVTVDSDGENLVFAVK